MKTIRVALFQVQPRLQSILIDAVAREDDMEIIPYQLTPGAAEDVDAPDAVVCQIDDPLDVAMPDSLLRTLPKAGRVLMVAETGDQAAVYELQPARRVFLNVSIEQLITAIRHGLN